MKNLIVLILLAIVIGSAIYYIINQKKKGAKCIGCPYAKECNTYGQCSNEE